MKLAVVALGCAATVAVATGGGGGTAAAAPAESSWASSRSLLDHFGIEVARQLVRGGNIDPDEAIRGVDRAVSLGTQDGVVLLVKLLGDPHGAARQSSRVLLSVTRALAPFAAQRAVARVLSEVVLSAPRAPPPARADDGQPGTPDPDRRARLELARQTAALAMARVRDPHATELLLVAARGGGVAQAAARDALLAFPPTATTIPLVLTPNAISLAVALRDVRAADPILEALKSLEPPVRIAALRGIGALGDARGLAFAEAAAADPDAAVRDAATTALVDLGAPGAGTAVRRLIEDDATAVRGIELAGRVSGEEITMALAARAKVSSNAPLRAAAVAALGLSDNPSALVALRDLMGDALLAGDAAEAIARSSQESAWPVIAETLRDPRTRRMGARMAALRGRVTGEIPRDVRASLHALAHASDGADRAVAMGALVLLGDGALRDGLADADARVRRAVAMASEPTDAVAARWLVAQIARETDGTTLLVLTRGLESDAATGAVPTATLRDRARGGDVDAAVSVLALARVALDVERDDVLVALGSSDPLLRAAAARGLGASRAPWASERLASAYESEVDQGVRRTLVAALARFQDGEEAPSRAWALDRAARLDPDAATRATAERALRSLPGPAPVIHDGAVWLRAMDARGKPLPLVVGALVRADGLAVPIVFDDDGYALSPAGAGPARLVLAPRLPAYEPEPHGD